MDPEDEQVQLQVRKLQDYITDHFYTCSDKILCGLGRMYAGGGELTENIDDVGGVGTAEFNKQLEEGMMEYEKVSRQILEGGTYNDPYHVEPIELTKKRQRKIFLVQHLLGWARYLF